ncbi:MAG: hypothetical protein ACR2GY_01955, partial [Phycisphaerales bacterium]
MKSRSMMSLMVKTVLAAAGIGLTGAVMADPPTIGPQLRVDNTGTISANETTASASDANPLDMISGWNDYRSDGNIRSGFALSRDGGAT